MRGIVLVNPSAGSGSADADEIKRRLEGSDVEECPPEKLAACVRRAVAEGRPWVGVAGGDGTLRSAAEAMIDSAGTLVPIPAGTRNHFAGELGLPDLDAVARAVDAGVARRVDVGFVNGHCFLNNSSIGIYPQTVIRREAHERRMPKRWAQLVAVWEQARHGHRFSVTVDGDRYRAWMVFVGNGCYGEGLFDLVEREAMDAGQLDVRVVRADRRLARTRVIAALVTGRLGRSPLLNRSVRGEVVIGMDRDTVEVALDGEVVELRPPLRYRVGPQALQVLGGADEP